MEAAGEGDDRGALRVVARDLDRVLDRLGAGRQENGLLGRLAGSELVELLGQRNVALVRRDLETGVRELIELGGDRRLDLGVQMPRIEDGNAVREVDVALALDVPKLGIRGTVGIDGQRVRDSPRDGFLAAVLQVGIRVRQERSPWGARGIL